jgi:hypothetical protein
MAPANIPVKPEKIKQPMAPMKMTIIGTELALSLIKRLISQPMDRHSFPVS